MVNESEANAPFLLAVLDRYEGQKAVLRFDDGQSLTVSKDLLFGEFKEGDSLIFFFTKDKNIQVARENFAKDILNTLLNKN